MSISFPITIKIIYEPEAVDAPYVAYIPEFDISSCGKTEEEAKKHAREVLEITLEEVEKKHKLEEFLKQAGISIKNSGSFPKISFEPFIFHS